MMNLDLLDRHGLLNVLEEDWVNVRFDKSSTIPKVTGATFNNVLRSLFLLHSQSPSAMQEILGGRECWEEVEESLMITMTTYATVREVTQRVYFLVLTYIDDGKKGHGRLFDVTYGALRLMYAWAAYYSIFLTDLQLTELWVGMEEIYRSPVTASYCKCGQLVVELRDLLLELTGARSCAVFSATPRLTASAPTAVTVGSAPSLVVSTGPVQPSVSHLEGSWVSDGLRASWGGSAAADGAARPLNRRSITRKDTALGGPMGLGAAAAAAPPPAPAPKVKFEMFGADAFMDGSDTESEASGGGDGGALGDSTSGEGDAASPNIPPAGRRVPVPRVAVGFPLLQDPRHFNVWSFDGLEVARQWTLIDQSLFRSVPLPAFLYASWSEARHSVRSSPPLRKFIDRFNAESAWATTAVLEMTTPEKRCERYCALVELAEHLHELNNFNGMMAVVSALRQSSICRLKRTLELVPTECQRKLNKLQSQMSTSTNYRNYREDLGRRLLLIPEFSVKACTAAGELVKQENAAGGSSFARRTSIVVSKSAMGSSTPPPVPTGSTANDVRAAMDDVAALNEDDCTGAVPYMAAHQQELQAVLESNPEYLPDAPHLLNVEKKTMTTRCVLLLARLQRSIYNLHSVRLIGCVINRSVQQYEAFSAADASALATETYNLSLSRES